MTFSFFTDLHKVTNQTSDNRSTCKHYSITLSFLSHFQHNQKRETIIELARIENTLGLDRFEEDEVSWDCVDCVDCPDCADSGDFSDSDDFDADEEETIEEASTETED